jgi:hypothetical protein
MSPEALGVTVFAAAPITRAREASVTSAAAWNRFEMWPRE